MGSRTLSTVFLRTLATALLAASVSLPYAEASYNYPGLKWKTLETEHFVIHYYDEVEWTASKVAAFADEMFVQVTDIYGYRPKRKTRIVVRDDEDTANGFAVFNLGYITIWASPSMLSLRGRKDWVREVLTHEFAHVISLQVSSGGGWAIEGLRLGGIAGGGTKENTYFGATALVPTNSYARWWAEGTAQLDTLIVGYDAWDPLRDMLLRSAALEDNLLDFDQMRSISSREHFGGELIYNQGMAFLKWLRERFGPDVNVRLAREAGRSWNLDFDRTLGAVTGHHPRDLHREWVERLRARYENQVAAIRENPMEGERITLVSRDEMEGGDPGQRPYRDGTFNAFPRFSPDGRWFSFVDDQVVRIRPVEIPFEFDDIDSKERPEAFTIGIPGRFYSWSPDSRRIVLAQRKPTRLGGFPYYDLYVSDLGPAVAARQEYLIEWKRSIDAAGRDRATAAYLRASRKADVSPRRISRGLRATHPAWSPDGRSIAFSQNQDGRRHLRLCDPDGGNPRDLVALGGDSEATDPAWSPDGRSIVFTLFHHGASDIWMVDADGGFPRPLTLDAAEDRHPVFSPDGREVFFSSDRSGIPQIYRMPMERPGAEPSPISRVETGAFAPFAYDGGSRLLYLRFSSFGFKPYRMDVPAEPHTGALEETAVFDAAEIEHRLSPEEFPPISGTPYIPWPRPVRFFPSFLYENTQFKAGLALQVSDYLEKHNLTALALLGNDRDYQVSYVNRMFHPDLFVRYSGYVRNDTFGWVNDGDGIDDDPLGLRRDDIQFIDAGLTQEIHMEGLFSGTHALSAAYQRRFVDRRLGFPFFIGDDFTTGFRLLTNDRFSLDWFYRRTPFRLPRDFDINPRDTWSVSAGYSLVSTGLATADTALNPSLDGYTYHEGRVSFARYFALPFSRPWWTYHTFWLQFIGGIKSRDVSINDEFFLGGRLNYRAFGQISSNTLFHGYEAFSVSGETMLLLSGGYTFPVARAIDRRWAGVYFDGVFATIFGEVGNAWSFGEFRNLRQNAQRDIALGEGLVLLQNIGAEIRLKAFLFNDVNRWNSIVRIAYGFQDKARYGFSDADWPVRIYIGVGTNF